jgi:hypothetical protein
MATPKGVTPLRMLIVLYFDPCDLLHQHVNRLKPYFFSDPNTQARVGQEFMTFTHYWLASLFVVAEGWKELKLEDPEIDKMIDGHWDSLRLFRNGVFHYQPKDRKHKQFFDVDKFNWAEKLHASLRTFFTAHEK